VCLPGSLFPLTHAHDSLSPFPNRTLAWTEIPGLTLDTLTSSMCTQSPISSPGADHSGPSSRRTSFSSTNGRPSTSGGRSGSGTSSRSTSFNLPGDAKGEIVGIAGAGGQDEVEEEPEMDEESERPVQLRSIAPNITSLPSGCEACSIYPGSRTALLERGGGHEGKFSIQCLATAFIIDFVFAESTEVA
jgi:hypothetical protein